jgi:WD40 repeat protein
VVAFSPSGRQILLGDYNGQVLVLPATGRKVRVLGPPGPRISDVEFNKSGSEFVTASASGVVTVWAARDGRPLHWIDACPSPNTASFSPDGSKIVVACGDGSAPVFAVVTGRQLTVLSAASAGTVSSAAFSPDGKTIVTAVDVGMPGACRSGTPSSRSLRYRRSNGSPNSASPASSRRLSARSTSPASAGELARLHYRPLRPPWPSALAEERDG